MAFRIGRSQPSADIPLWIRYHDLSRSVNAAIDRGDRRAFRYHARARLSVLHALGYLLERAAEHETMAAAAVPDSE